MSVDGGTRVSDGTRIGALWASVLLGPLAALTALELAYVLVQRACATGQVLPIHLGFLGTLLAALAGAAIGWREWRRWGGGPDADRGDRGARSHFLALHGLISSLAFALVIVAQWSATLFLHPCQ